MRGDAKVPMGLIRAARRIGCGHESCCWESVEVITAVLGRDATGACECGIGEEEGEGDNALRPNGLRRCEEPLSDAAVIAGRAGGWFEMREGKSRWRASRH